MKRKPIMDLNGDGKFDAMDMALYETAHNLAFAEKKSNEYSLLHEYEDDDFDELCLDHAFDGLGSDFDDLGLGNDLDSLDLGSGFDYDFD